MFGLTLDAEHAPALPFAGQIRQLPYTIRSIQLMQDFIDTLMNTSSTNPLAPAVAGSQLASDQLAAQRAKREIRKMRGAVDSAQDVRAIEDPVAIEEIHDQKKEDQLQDQKKKKKPEADDEHQLDVTA